MFKRYGMFPSLSVIAKSLPTMLNVFTTRGDTVRAGVAGAPERVALGTAGQVQGSDGTDSGVWMAGARPGAGHRCTLTTGVPVTTSDVTGATTVYSTPYHGDHVLIYNGSGFLPYSATELSLALDSNSGHTNYHQSGKNFDLFWINDAGTIRLGTGPVWSSDTARGTGAGTTELELKDGIQTNKNTITIRYGSASGDTVSVAANRATYAGSFRCTANGQTEDSAAKRFLWNNYNRVARTMRNATETADTWTYTTAALRQANANTANQLDMLIGLSEDEVSAVVTGAARNDGAPASVLMQAGIGLDATNANATGVQAPACFNLVTNVAQPLTASWRGIPGIGRHFLAWLEYSTASGTTTWVGDVGNPSIIQSGITGEILA